MNNKKVGLLTQEEVEQKKRILGSFGIDSLGDKIYQLPNGGLTGQGGWDLFCKAVQDAAGKMFKDDKKSSD